MSRSSSCCCPECLKWKRHLYDPHCGHWVSLQLWQAHWEFAAVVMYTILSSATLQPWCPCCSPGARRVRAANKGHHGKPSDKMTMSEGTLRKHPPVCENIPNSGKSLCLQSICILALPSDYGERCKSKIVWKYNIQYSIYFGSWYIEPCRLAIQIGSTSICFLIFSLERKCEAYLRPMFSFILVLGTISLPVTFHRCKPLLMDRCSPPASCSKGSVKQPRILAAGAMQKGKKSPKIKAIDHKTSQVAAVSACITCIFETL